MDVATNALNCSGKKNSTLFDCKYPSRLGHPKIEWKWCFSCSIDVQRNCPIKLKLLSNLFERFSRLYTKISWFPKYYQSIVQLKKAFLLLLTKISRISRKYLLSSYTLYLKIFRQWNFRSWVKSHGDIWAIWSSNKNRNWPNTQSKTLILLTAFDDWSP